jgi:hypothetical protein
MSTYNRSDACKVAEAIPGWLEPEVTAYLYDVGFNSRGNILEIGTYFGKSTYLIGRGIRDAGKPHHLVTVDIHSRGVDPQTQKPLVLAEDSPAFLLKSLKEHGLQHHVIQMIGWSDRCIPLLDLQSVETVFIDGGHDYESCSKDFLAVTARLPRQRRLRLMFHDYGSAFPGVQRTIDELVRRDGRFQPVGQVCSLFVCDLTPQVQAAA